MSRKVPTVSQLMTRMPLELDRNDSIAQAKKAMARHGIRHIPVMSGAKLYGIVSERDIDILLAAVAGADMKLTLAELCAPDPYQVLPTAKISEVAAEMAERRIGSAVVVDAQAVVGIITATDMMRALVDAYR
jgi:acetoin utilization protein AcuB